MHCQTQAGSRALGIDIADSPRELITKVQTHGGERS